MEPALGGYGPRRTAVAVPSAAAPPANGSPYRVWHRGRPNTADETRRGTVAQKAQTYEGYCVKCKEKRTFDGNVEVSKTGMEMAKGKCPVCGTTVNRILGKAKAGA
jgi:hypothetical protein